MYNGICWICYWTTLVKLNKKITLNSNEDFSLRFSACLDFWMNSKPLRSVIHIWKTLFYTSSNQCLLWTRRCRVSHSNFFNPISGKGRLKLGYVKGLDAVFLLLQTEELGADNWQPIRGEIKSHTLTFYNYLPSTVFVSMLLWCSTIWASGSSSCEDTYEFLWSWKWQILVLLSSMRPFFEMNRRRL